jgi:hypothetical protein
MKDNHQDGHQGDPPKSGPATADRGTRLVARTDTTTTTRNAQGQPKTRPKENLVKKTGKATNSARSGKAINPVKMTGKATNPVKMTGKAINPANMTGKATNPVKMTGKAINPVNMTGKATTHQQIERGLAEEKQAKRKKKVSP